MRCERCGHPRASSSRPCFVTTPLRAAIGLEQALPRGEGRSCRRRSDKRSRLRQDDSAECCCSHHPCSNDAPGDTRAVVLTSVTSIAFWEAVAQGRISPLKRRICPRFMAGPARASQTANYNPHQNGRRERAPTSPRTQQYAAATPLGCRKTLSTRDQYITNTPHLTAPAPLNRGTNSPAASSGAKPGDPSFRPPI